MHNLHISQFSQFLYLYLSYNKWLLSVLFFHVLIALITTTLKQYFRLNKNISTLFIFFYRRKFQLRVKTHHKKTSCKLRSLFLKKYLLLLLLLLSLESHLFTVNYNCEVITFNGYQLHSSSALGSFLSLIIKK